ncbi:MAG: J domain-containing protein [Desulfuromonadales bacterium]
MTYAEFREALTVFALTDRATLREIKDRHRRLVKNHHPDRCGGETETIRRINAAYRLLLDYCQQYRFCFDREEFFEQNPEERLREQFAPDSWRK